MSEAGLSAGAAAVRVSTRPIDTDSRRASSDQGGSTGFPDLLSKMAVADNGSVGRPALSMPERRSAWGAAASRTASTPDKADDAEATLAALLAGQSEPSKDATDQSSAVQQPVTSPLPDLALAGVGGNADGGSVWASTVQIQALVTTGVGAPQVVSARPRDCDAAPSAIVDAATLIQMARDAQGSAIATSPRAPESLPNASAVPQDAATSKEALRDFRAVANAAKVITAVAQETHIASAALAPQRDLGAVSGSDAPTGEPISMPVLASQAQPAGEDGVAAQEPPRDPAAAIAYPVTTGRPSSAPAQGTHTAPTQMAQAAQAGRDRAAPANIEDEGTTPLEGAEQVDSAPLPGRTGGSPAGKPAAASAQQLSPTARSPSQPAGDRSAKEQAENSLSATDRTASVAANEPPHSPVSIPTPAHQVAGQILAAAHIVESEAAGSVGVAAPQPTASGVVKVLRLELQPTDLGTITIRLALKQDGLDIRVEASRHDTARLLQQDQDSLAKLLTSAGYRIDGMTVVSAPIHSAAAPDGGSQAFVSSSPPQQGEAAPQPDSRSSERRSSPQSDPRTSRGNQDDDNGKSRTARGPGGDLYV